MRRFVMMIIIDSVGKDVLNNWYLLYGSYDFIIIIIIVKF